MSANWIGTQRITQICYDFTIEIENLLTQKKNILHISRVRPYLDVDVGEQLPLQKIAEFGDRLCLSVETVKDIRNREDTVQVMISWNVLTSFGDTWEPLSVIYEATPTILCSHFAKKGSSSFLKEKKSITL